MDAQAKAKAIVDYQKATGMLPDNLDMFRDRLEADIAKIIEEEQPADLNLLP